MVLLDLSSQCVHATTAMSGTEAFVEEADSAFLVSAPTEHLALILTPLVVTVLPVGLGTTDHKVEATLVL